MISTKNKLLKIHKKLIKNTKRKQLKHNKKYRKMVNVQKKLIKNTKRKQLTHNKKNRKIVNVRQKLIKYAPNAIFWIFSATPIIVFHLIPPSYYQAI